MSDIAIKVEGIGKKYRIGKRKSGEFRESFGNLIQLFKSKASSQQPAASSSFWALKDISFEVKQGEAVGIIGKNGAGKSTLLKVLSRITKPTTGRFEINGRVSSLLEVGTGFHPELTGRENIYLNGTILGMRRAEIKAKFDEIIAFSGVEEFIDTPVKHYSSGMKVRLAFSVAAHLEPEILIIDEVLAVGDAEFQKKCLGKMENVTGEGRTVMFVSHNMGVIQKLCKDGLLIERGSLLKSGNITECVNHYLNSGDLQNISKSQSFPEIDFLGLQILDNEGREKDKFSNSDEITVQLKLKVKKAIKKYKLCLDIENSQGDTIISSFHNDLKNGIFGEDILPGDYLIYCYLPSYIFNAGKFHISLAFGIHQVRWIFQLKRIFSFTIDFAIPNPSFSANKRESLIAPMLRWSLL